VAARVTRSFDGVVFDLFGTLVPEFSKSDFFERTRSMAQVLGADPDAFVEQWNRTAIARQTGGFPDVESNVRAICEALDVRIDEAALTQALEIRLALYRRWFHPRPGAVETLRTCCERGYRTALISMCAPDAPAMWRASDLSPFVDVEVFSSEVGLRKPDPEIYRYTSERMGVAPSACLYVGDGAYGELSGAASVGMTPYLIADPEVDAAEQLTPEPDEWNGARVADLRDLLRLLPARR